MVTPGDNNEKHPVHTLLKHIQRLINKKINE